MIFLILGSFHLASNNPDEKQKENILQKMFNTIDNLSCTTYKGIIKARIDGKIQTQRGDFKVVKTPFKFYYKQDYPQKGQEVLYVEGNNENKAIINTNSFPWVNVHLDPNCKLMRQDNHHSLYNAGFWYFNNVVKELVNSDRGVLKYDGTKSFNEKECFVYELCHKNYQLIKYKIKEGETLQSIAKKRNINDYMIVEINKNIDNLFDYKEGQEILIPNDYAKKLILYIDANTFVPVVIYIYDHLGLYEEINYVDVEINPMLKGNEFNPNYSEYNF